MKNATQSLSKSIWFIPVVLTLLLISTQEAKSEADLNAEPPTCKVGIYDSRAVAMAYYRSEFFSRHMSGLHESMKKAQEEGNESKINELNEKGKDIQAKAHRQGFGNAPVDEVIEQIKDKLPEIAKKTGVDLIVSKWKIDYQSPGTKYVDVTDQMVQPFSPSPETLKVIQDIQKKDPVPLDELQNHEH